MNKPVIVLSGGRSTLPLVRPLAEKYNLAFLYPQVGQHVASQDIPVVDLTSWVTQELKGESVNEALRLASKVSIQADKGSLDAAFNEIMLSHGIRGDGASLQEWLPARAFQSFSRVILRTKLWEKLTEALEVKACITHEDVSEDTKAMCSYFRGVGVPTLHVPHAVYMDQWRGDVGDDIHDEITCEWIAVSGSFQKDWYTVRGAKNTVITGAPHWDKWTGNKDRAWCRKVLQVPDDRKLVLYASSWAQATSALGMHNAIDVAYRAILDAAKETDDWVPVIKLHPNSSAQGNKLHVEMAEKAGVKCMVTPHHLDLLFGAADLVVAVGPSNILIEAALLGIPCVSLYGFETDEAILTCQSEDLPSAIRDGLSDGWGRWFESSKDAFIEKYAHSGDGKATERVLSLLGDMTNA